MAATCCSQMVCNSRAGQRVQLPTVVMPDDGGRIAYRLLLIAEDSVVQQHTESWCLL